MKVSRTINRLHFEDLNPLRYEDLIFNMVYRMNDWHSLDHYGRAGSDDGFDISGLEVLENGKERRYCYQCKRVINITKSELKRILDDFICKNPLLTDKYILVLGCTIRKKSIEEFISYGKKLGIGSVEVWTSSNLEAMLYAEFHDLLYTYFGVNLLHERNRHISTIRRNNSLKKRMIVDFLEENMTVEDWIDSTKHGDIDSNDFKYEKLLVRSIDDNNYPVINLGEKCAFFSCIFYNFYFNGIIVCISPDKKNIKIKSDDSEDTEALSAVKVSYLPYGNIIDYDVDGDEIYSYPHIFCDFEGNINPFEKNGFLVKDKDGKQKIYNEDEIIELSRTV